MSGDIPKKSAAVFTATKYGEGRLCVLLIHDVRQKTHDFLKDDVQMQEKSQNRIDNDLKQLESAFGDVIKEKIVVNDGLQTEAFKDKLKKFAEDLSRFEVAAFLCVFLGFGGPEYVFLGREGGKIQKMDFAKIVQQFNGENCAALVMKPKIFFVQAEAIRPVKPADGTFSGEAGEGALVRIPIHADIFVYFSSALAGELWNEVPLSDGGGDGENVMSRFVHLLCYEIRNLTSSMDIQQIVIRMNLKIQAAKFKGDKKPREGADLLPLATSQLTKDLFLADFIPSKPRT